MKSKTIIGTLIILIIIFISSLIALLCLNAKKNEYKDLAKLNVTYTYLDAREYVCIGCNPVIKGDDDHSLMIFEYMFTEKETYTGVESEFIVSSSEKLDYQSGETYVFQAVEYCYVSYNSDLMIGRVLNTNNLTKEELVVNAQMRIKTDLNKVEKEYVEPTLRFLLFVVGVSFALVAYIVVMIMLIRWYQKPEE